VRRFNAAFFFGRALEQLKESGVETPHSKTPLSFFSRALLQPKESGVETPHSKTPPANSRKKVCGPA
jgi:hypothetical protein